MTDTPKEFWDIYKYESFEIAEAIISNCSLKFTDPKYFNDPFDCDLNGIYFNLDGVIDKKVQKEIEQLKKDFAFTTLSKEMLVKVYKDTISDKVKRSVATCFSLDKNNHLMWSHYARNHTGICLGFDNRIPIKEKFTDLQLGIEGEMNYDFHEKVNFCADKITGNQRLYLTKLEPWKYEKEFRLVALADEGIYHFRKEFLKTVIFGLRVKQEQIDRIVRVCDRVKLNVEIFRTEVKGSDLVYSKFSR